MPTIGLLTAGSVLVGQRIGANDVLGAKKYQRLTQMTGLCMGLFLGTVIFVFREMIAEFYTNIEDVKEETVMLFAFLAVFH